MVIKMNAFAAKLAVLGAAAMLAGCAEGPLGGLTPYQQGGVIATNHDTGVDAVPLVNGEAAVAYDGDGCQVWIKDNGVEGYAGRRFDNRSGLPVCNNAYPPGTVVGNYQDQSAPIGDWVPRNS